MRSDPWTIRCSVSSTRSIRLIITSVPISKRCSGTASPSEVLSGRTLTQASSFSSLESAASTAAIEAGRPTASGTIVSGNSVMFVSGRTGISKGTPSRLVDTGGAASLSDFVSASAIGLKNESSVNYKEGAGSLSTGGARLAFPARFLLLLPQPQDQKAVMIIAFDGCVLDRAGE